MSDPQPNGAPKGKPNAKGKAVDGVRPGDTVKFRKCTEAERDERVDVIARELSAHPLLTKGELKEFIKCRFKLKFAMAERYINRARALLRQRSGMSRRQAADFVVNKLFHIAHTGTNGEATKAISQLVSIFGLEVPRRHELTGLSGGPIATKDETPVPAISAERKRELVAMAEAVAAERNGGTD